MNKLLFFISVFLLLPVVFFAAPISSTAVGGNWSNPASWNGGVVPSTSDDVTIASGATITLDQDASVLSLTVDGILNIGNDATIRNLIVDGNTIVSSTGAVNVSAFDIAHSIELKGDLTNNGTFALFNNTSQVANLSLNGNITISGTNPLIFAKVVFIAGTVTTSVSLDINDAILIEDGAVFDAGNLAHTVAGNWTVNGTGQLTGTSTIVMDAQFAQSVTTSASFYNLTFGGGGIGVLSQNVTVNGDFLITNNTQVQTSQYHTFFGDFSVDDGSKYEATDGRCSFISSTQQQTINVGTTSGLSNISFYQAYFDNGGGVFPKLINGNMIVQNTFYIYDDAVVNDNGDALNQTLQGGGYINGICNFSGTVTFTGGTFQDNDDDDFKIGTADIIVKGYTYIGSGDIMRVDGDVTILPNDDGNHIGLIINNNSELIDDSGSNNLTVSDNTSLYIRGYDNFPTTFANVDLATASFVRYDVALADQLIYDGVTYGGLYLSQGTTKTAAGNLDINNHLYVYNHTTLQLLSFDHTLAGNIYNSDDSWGHGSILATGGSFTMDADDANQTVTESGTGTYTFHDLVLTSNATTNARTKTFQNDFVVTGDFITTNTGGSSTNVLNINIDYHDLTGGNNFSLGANVKFYSSGVDNFKNAMTSFSGTKTLDVNSTVRFNRTVNGSDQQIPGAFTYGNIELYGSNNKIPQNNLDVNGDFSVVGYTPVLTDNSHQINVAGDWNMSLATTNITGNCYVVFDGVNQIISQSNFANVYFTNTGTKYIYGTLDILKNLVIQNDVVIDDVEHNIYIEGNWTEQGTSEFHQIAGGVFFDGTSANQTVQTNANSYFYNFYITKPGVNKLVTFNSEIDINGTLDFADGNAQLNLNGNDLHVARDFNYRNGCTFTHNNGKVYFDGNEIAQLLRNLSSGEIIFADVEFSGSAVKRLYDNSFRFKGDVTINNATLDGQWVEHYVEGNWNNTGVFRHSSVLHFVGEDQNISSSSFYTVRFGGGNFVKTLSGDINLNGHLYIDDATLDVSAANNSITVENNWYNDSTGSFIAHNGTVTIKGEYSYLFSGESNTAYGSGSLTTQGGTKSFYNLIVNKNSNDYWLLLRGDLHVLNNFEIITGDYRQSNDPNNYGINDIYVGGDFISHGQFRDNNYGEFIDFNPTTGSHVFDPGSSNSYGIVKFNGAVGSVYNFQSNFNLYNNREITVNSGYLDLNSNKIFTNSSGGDFNLNGGTIEVDSAAHISLGDQATFTNNGGVLKLIGHSDYPASLLATSGNYYFLQTNGEIHAQNFRIENTAGNGIEIQGGIVDQTNTFINGSFSSGAGNSYLTLDGLDLIVDRTLTGVTFNDGPTYNVQRTSGNGVLTFENAVGTLAGENYDNDNGDPGTLVIWTYPGAVFWDGNTDGDGDNIHWNDPLNWANDAVPDASSIVILDHNAVGGAYTVSLSSVADGFAKSLSIESCANSISLVLNGQMLSVAEDITVGGNSILTQTNATDTIFVGGNWSNLGTFNEGTATVVFNPVAGTQTITTQGAGDAFYGFKIAGTSGTNVISSNLDINGDVQILSGTLTAGNKIINVAGNWTYNGIANFDYGTSTVIFDNNGNQDINGGEFYNFKTENSGTKNVTANIDINQDITIGAGTILNGNTSIIFVGDDWTNKAGNNAFVQTGAGTVIFDGTVSDQNIGTSATFETTFNNLIISGTRTKYTQQNVNVDGNLIISDAALYILDGTVVDGTGGSNLLSMSAGRIYVNGSNNFPQNFETINLTGGTVDYYANIDQTVFPTTYYALMVRRINSGNQTTKTLAGDITVNNSLYIYDDETLLDVDNHTINLWGNLSLADNGRQIDWGTDGTLIHFGEYWTVDKDIAYLNNVIKKNRGHMRCLYRSIEITGDLSIIEDAYLQQDTVNIISTGANKTFTISATARAYIYNPKTVGTSSGRKAFPINFANYALHKDSRVYIAGTIGDQDIYTVPNYGNLYLYTNSAINMYLDGDLDVEGELRMYDPPTLIDNGHNINAAGAIVDLRDYMPSATSTITFDGADQAIYDAGSGATVFDMNDVVFAGSGQKSLHYSGDDWYYVFGDLTINPGVTVYIPRRLDFSGSTWTNNGIFNHTAYIVNFIGNTPQVIDPGLENDFYSVLFSNSGLKTFVNNGIDVNNGAFTLETGSNVNMNTLTHTIASERITNNGGTWNTDNANLIFDRNGTQYIPALTCNHMTFRRYDQWDRVRYLEGDININDLNIEEGTQLRCAQSVDETATRYNVTISGNFNNDGYLYAWGNTFAFESNDNNPKTIKQGQGSFDFVTFNQVIWGQNTRTYTLLEETRFYEDLTIGQGATLDLNSQTLRLGNDDPNEPVEPQAEQHVIQTGGTLDVDAGAALLFSCRDVGNPVLNVYGTLKMVGVSGNNATITSADYYTNSKRIDININNGGTIAAQYYLVKYVTADGFYVDAGANIDPTFNFSDGTWSDINTSGGRYLYCNADVSSIGTINNLTFNYGGTPSVGTHFNIKRDASCATVMTLSGTSAGLLAGSTYEEDEVAENNTASSKIEWPPITELYWTGNVSTDWFDANNWSPIQVPDNSTTAVIPIRNNNPIINGNDAICKNLLITSGYLTLRNGYDLFVEGNVDIGIGADVAILSVEDPNCDITVTGNWQRGQNAVFIHGNGDVIFNAGGGSVSIDSRSSAFGNVFFDGGATFLLNRTEIFVDGDFIINAGTVQPIVNNYLLHIKGDYSNPGGNFDDVIQGTVYFDGMNNQSISNALFWNVIIDGSGTKTTTNSCVINGRTTVKNGILAGACAMDLNNYVTIEATGGFNDGGFSHTFSGYRWIGEGSYTGAGEVIFDRDGYQLIGIAKFNNLTLINQGAVTIEDDITMTGNLSLKEPNTYLNVQTYQITNTAGTGTFSMADNRRIYVRGANNFPIGFSDYLFHENSYTMYDGTMEQIIAPIPVVYGRLYLDNSNKLAGGHLDIDGILYFYDDASLDVTANNYRINIEGHWNNQHGATFIPQQGEVVFDGNDVTTNIYIYEDSKLTNPFYKLTINKGAGRVNSNWTDITVQNNLRVLNGELYQDEIMYVGGDISALSGKFMTAGTYYLNKPSGVSYIQMNNSVLNNLTIDAGAEYFLQDELQLNGNFNLIAGTFDGNRQTVRLGDYGEVHEISGIYKIGGGGFLKISNYGTFKVNSGGEVWVIGDVFDFATVSNHTGRYYFNVESGGTILARNYLFEFMSENGIYIKDGAIINPDFNFSYGSFTNPAAGGSCLRIENNQIFTEANGNPIVDVSFPVNPGGNSSNVSKTITFGGQIDFKDYTGEFAGEDFDNDPENLVNWISEPYVMWTGNIDNDWYKIGNWEVISGPDRIPLITDNVIITLRTNQPIIDHDGAVAKTIDVQQNAILTLNTTPSADVSLTVSEDVFFDGTIIMTSVDDTLKLGGNWNNSGMFMPGNGTVAFNSILGIKSLDNLNDFFYNLYLETDFDVQLTRNLTVLNDFIIKNGAFDLTTSNRQLTVKGNFLNYDDFVSQNGKLILAGTNPTQIFNPGTSDYYIIDVNADNATNVVLTNNDLYLDHNFNLNSGTFLLNGIKFYMGDNISTDKLTVSGGSFIIGANSYLKPGENSTIEINSGGVFKIVGSDVDHPAYINSQQGAYHFYVNNGGKIDAKFYNIMNTAQEGIKISAGATIDPVNNFSYGVWRNGTPSGQYLWLENDFADYTAVDVYFHGGATYNVRRETGTGIVTFQDALGTLSGADFEEDSPDGGENTGNVRWVNSHNQYIWVGSVSSDWNDPNNWNVTAPHVVPTIADIALIPDIDENTNWNPILNSGADGGCFDLIIEDGGFLTIGNNKNLEMDNSIVVASGATVTVTPGSVSNISVADIYIMEGEFNHGGSSTVTFDAPSGKILAISSSSNFYNLTINSIGIAEYSTGTSLHIDGSFSILSGVFSISAPQDTIYLGGDWVNNTTFNHGDGVVVCNGANQNIDNNGNGSFYNLNIKCAGTTSLIADLIVENDLHISRNSTFGTNNNSFEILGDWINRGTFIPSNGTVSFVGNHTQLINNYNDEYFYNFTLNNTSAAFPQVILYSNLHLLSGSNWSMLDGVFETSTTEMLFVEDNVTLIGGNTQDSYVSGPVTKFGDDDFIFPIGQGAVFARLGLDISNTSNATFVAQYHDYQYSDIVNVTSPLHHVSGSEHWTLDRLAGTETPYLTFYWEDGARSGIDKLSHLTTAEYVTNSWEDRQQGSITGTIAQGSITSGQLLTTFGACGYGALDVDNPLNCYNLWTGLISTEWNNPNNWTIGVPNATLNSLIPAQPENQPLISCDAVSAQLVLGTGASLIINPLFSLTAEGKFYIYGDLTLKSDNTGNASLINNNSISYGPSCNVITELYLQGGVYHHVSSPTTATDADRFKVDPVAPYFNPNFYAYDELNLDPIWTDGWYEHTGIMTPMDGYTVYFNTSPTIIFDRNISGDFNTGDKSKALTYTGASLAPVIHRGWNFVGNPYPAHLDWDAPGWTKTNLYNSIYFWNGNNYSYYVSSGTAQDNGIGTNNGTSIIPPMQGYFVKVMEGADPVQNQTGALVTPASARTTATHAFWKQNQPKDNTDVIRITIDNGQTDETVIRFLQDATQDLDAQYDAFKLFPDDAYGVPQVFSVLDDEVYAAINTLSSYNKRSVIPVGVRVPSSGGFYLNIEPIYLSDDIVVYLEDLYENETYEIKDGADLYLNSDAGQFNDRFIIKFQNIPVTNINSVVSDVDIYSNNQTLYLKSDTYDAIVGDVFVYNVAGQIVYNNYNQNQYFTEIDLSSLSEGIYLVKLATENGILTGKIVLKK